jgi:hypothetical protein
MVPSSNLPNDAFISVAPSFDDGPNRLKVTVITATDRGTRPPPASQFCRDDLGRMLGNCRSRMVASAMSNEIADDGLDQAMAAR